jgi:ethanolamine utilization protein EutN
MELARVEGNVVSTMKTSRLKRYKLLLLNILTAKMQLTGNFVVAVDTVGAGYGEVVLLVRGSSARQVEDLSEVPTDATIVAIIDSVELDGSCVYDKRTASESGKS